MGLRSSVLLIKTTSQTYPDASMDAMYYVSPGISSVCLVSYTDASCSSYLIPSTNCLTPVDFSRFNHDGYLPSTEFTGVNSSFAAGMPIVVWWHFTRTDKIFFKFNCPNVL